MVATVYSRVPYDPDETHHPERGCAERSRIEREGNAVYDEAEVPRTPMRIPGRFKEVALVVDEDGNITRTLPWCSSGREIVLDGEPDSEA